MELLAGNPFDSQLDRSKYESTADELTEWLKENPSPESVVSARLAATQEALRKPEAGSSDDDAEEEEEDDDRTAASSQETSKM